MPFFHRTLQLYCSHISFKLAAQKHAQLQLVVSQLSPLHPWTKHMVHPFFTALLRLLVEMMYHIVYRIVALTSIHVSYLEKLYCCSPTLTILDRHFTTKKLKQTK